jgi:hypothetical protein
MRNESVPTHDLVAPVAYNASTAKTAALPLIIGASLYLRLFAMFSIIWFHTPGAPFRMLAGPGIVLFLCLSFMHVAYHDTFWPALVRRSKRLLMLWALWWCFYAVVQAWTHRDDLSGLVPNLSIATPLAWPAIHLWYLLFLFVMTTIAQLISLALRPFSLATQVTFWMIVGLALLCVAPYDPGLPDGLIQWWKASPSIGIGMTFGLCMRLRGDERMAAFAAIIVLVSLVSFTVLSGTPEGLAYSIGSGLMMLCTVRVPRSRTITKLGSLTLGVFLLHPFVLMVLIKFVGAGCPFGLMVSITLAGTTLLTYAIRQLPYGKKIL